MSKVRGKQRRGRARQGGGAGFVRIIGGDWRGRKIPVADVEGLRPSGDRGRETLFNWLQGKVHGARCADLFAGTGVLGLEAASRGAAEVTLIERSRKASESLRATVEMLDVGHVSVIEADAIEWLQRQAPQSLDIVFIDPPFDTNLAVSALEILRDQNCLASEALVYLEQPRASSPDLPAGYAESREKLVGEVRIRLLRPVETI